LEVTAYHEAGHVVVRWVLGECAARVSIRADDDSFGHAVLSPAFTYEQTHRGWRLLVKGSLAGPLAEEIVTGSWNEVGAAGDLANMDHSLWLLAGWDDDQYARLLSRFKTETRRLLRQNWHLVESVSTALLEHDELSGDQLYELLSAGTDN
jgi:ATP-dependent Zn protease